MRSDGWQVGWLVAISFLYGVFHAAGPGHGKAVISSYMIANETELRRGVLISFLSAFMQGATAILVTGAGFLILRGTTFTMTDAAKWLEVASFGMIVVFGFYLLFRKLRGLMPSPSLQLASGGALALAGVGHDHGHDHEHCDHGHGHKLHGHHDHDHPAHAAGQVCEVCGHAHVPTPDMVSGDRFSLMDAWGAITAVGLRPCSGALLVLTFSFLNGLYMGGVLSVLAMSIGTAITVSILATIAVTAKDTALKFAGGGAFGGVVANTIEIGGAVVVILFGLVLLLASLQIA
jgi:ABC-type nickel/cobalt efflux system permease component RcnA